MESTHVPVMPDEVLRYVVPSRPDGLHVDATLGEGGHSELFLEQYPSLRVIGIDADATMIDRARRRLSRFEGRFSVVHSWYDSFFESYAAEERPVSVLFDLGVSSYHLDAAERGFSFRAEEPIDMRLMGGEQTSAADLVHEMRESELADIIYHYGDERYSRRIARAIVTARGQGRIETSAALAEIVFRAVPPQYRHGRIHPATRTFQALRVAVNDELDRLRRAVAAAFARLEIGGTLGVISFHSHEDRIVKRFLREKQKACTCPPEEPMCICGGEPACEVLTKKPISPADDEVARNARSRSARFRAGKKIAEVGGAA
jgi:16S rRNA (cytosine1402-N4)-methyltransferase